MAQIGPNTATKWPVPVYFQTEGQTQGLEVWIVKNNFTVCISFVSTLVYD